MNSTVLRKFYYIIGLICLIAVADVYGVEPQIRQGNVLNITVFGYPELSKSVMVRQDGTIDYPLLSDIPIDGMTSTELRELLRPILTRYVERPNIFISIAEFRRLRVTVQGQVRLPGPYEVTGPIDLQGVLTVAGGVTKEADLRNVSILRRDGSRYSEIKIDLYEFFHNREDVELPDIEDDDILFVPMMTTASFVRVMGAVHRPGTYLPVRSENISDMINMAGGYSSTANMKKVRFIALRDGQYINRVINLKKLINEGLTDQIPHVQPGDIIIVEELPPWHIASWWMQVLRDAAYLASAVLIIINM